MRVVGSIEWQGGALSAISDGKTVRLCYLGMGGSLQPEELARIHAQGLPLERVEGLLRFARSEQEAGS